MLSPEEIHEIAAQWARHESVRRGYRCTPVLTEFDLGYVVWSRPPDRHQSTPGDGRATVIDKETGRLTMFPGVPPPMVPDRYRQQVAAERSGDTSHPDSVLGTTATLTTRHGEVTASGVRDEEGPEHHPLVRAYLRDLAPGRLTRGGERHAELVALSRALREYGPELGESAVHVSRMRDLGDPRSGVASLPCESCVHALVHFGVLPESYLIFLDEVPAEGPDPVARALRAGGWRPDVADEAAANAMVARVVEAGGHQPIPAAATLLAEYLHLSSTVRGPGEQVYVRRFSLDPMPVARTAGPLGRLARSIGSRLFPIGSENGDSILAVDEQGRIFALDQAGDWFLGPDIQAALAVLILGRTPERVRADGSW